MAKQSGIHQLRGKVGEMSYYRQAGVVPGLVRRINQSMSSRVKTSDEFANTRLNNDEFKKANKYATLAFHSVNPSWRTMFRRFAIATMTKRFLEYIKAGTGYWGNRIPVASFGPMFEDVLENYAKLGQYQGQYGELTKSEETLSIGTNEYYVPVLQLSADRSLTPVLAAEGINGLRFYTTEVIVCDMGIFINGRKQDVPITRGYPTGPDDEVIDETIVFSIDTPEEVGLSQADLTVLLNATNRGAILVTALVPLRQVNNTWYELQEKATFVVHGTDMTQD